MFLLLALVLAAACSGRTERAEKPGGTEGGAPAPETPAQAVEPPKAGEVLLLFPGTDDDYLHVEKRTVLPIDPPEDRAMQCLEELFRGPSPGLLAMAPEGARARQVYLLPDGTAYVDLSPEILSRPGGSQAELQTIYAIVNTLAMNVPQIARVGILVEGEPRETLAGHVYTQRLFTPDFRFVEESARPPGWKAAPAAPAEGAEKQGATGNVDLRPGGAARPGENAAARQIEDADTPESKPPPPADTV